MKPQRENMKPKEGKHETLAMYAKSDILRYVWVTVRKRGPWLLGSRADAGALKHQGKT